MLWLWIALAVLMAGLIAVEVLSQRAGRRVPTPGEALTGLAFWIVTAVLGFSVLVYFVFQDNWETVRSLIEPVVGLVGVPTNVTNLKGNEAVVQFLTAYATELILCLDNVAVMGAAIAFFKIPPRLAFRVLFVAMLASLVVRLALVLAGGALLVALPWFEYVFVGLLGVAIVRTLLLPDEGTNFSRRWLARLVRRIAPMTADPDDGRWILRRPRGGWVITPLLMCTIVVVVGDVSYAADSIPAAFSITHDPLLAFAGQAMVILSLRSLYFCVAPTLGRVRYLRLSIVFVLIYIVIKTLWFEQGQVATEITLGVVLGALATAIFASLAAARGKARMAPRPSALEDLNEAALATKRNFRKVVILIAGTAVIIFAIIIAPLPGPGPTVLIPIGVAILATEFVWAKTLFDRGKALAIKVTERSDRVSRSIPRWVALPALLAFYGFWTSMYFGWWRDVYPDPPGEKFWKGFAMATAFGLSFPVLGWAYRLVFRKGQRGEKP